MVTTTVLMLFAFSLSTSNLEDIDPAASTICFIVDSILFKPVRPFSAAPAAISATADTSSMVVTNSFEVAEISVAVVTISLVVAACSATVASSCFEVAAMDVVEDTSCSPECCTWVTSLFRLLIICCTPCPRWDIASLPSIFISPVKSPAAAAVTTLPMMSTLLCKDCMARSFSSLASRI